MAYNHSHLDKRNLIWFEKDYTKALLKHIVLKGHIRSMNDCRISFLYPITVISGKNGSGKSTVLALAACAYHNTSKGFKLNTRENTYYTFSDFFVQSSDDIKPEGISIWYGISFNNWAKNDKFPKGIGLGYQKTKKKKGGRWSNYERRVKRDVVFIGIERIVPHSEKSAHKTYKSKFKDQLTHGMEDTIASDVGYILDKDFSSLNFKRYHKYKLPIVEADIVKYSGFNMGAGENALFELFYVLHRAPEGTLIIIDEIELGLHESAQNKLIEKLKEICFSKKHQIICTSHSPAIIKSVPPEGRIHLECLGKITNVLPGISAEYATGKMGSRNSEELLVFIEDNIGDALIQNSIDVKTRMRTKNFPIGSSSAIMRQMAAMHKMNNIECIAILDGDKKNSKKSQINLFIKSLETFKTEAEKSAAIDWIENRLYFLPGESWPEKWIIETLLKNNTEHLALLLRTTRDELSTFLKKALRAGKHNEFHSLGKSCDLDKEICLNYAVNTLNMCSPEESQELDRIIKSHLE